MVEHEHAAVSLADALFASILAHAEDKGGLTPGHLWLKRAFVKVLSEVGALRHGVTLGLPRCGCVHSVTQPERCCSHTCADDQRVVLTNLQRGQRGDGGAGRGGAGGGGGGGGGSSGTRQRGKAPGRGGEPATVLPLGEHEGGGGGSLGGEQAVVVAVVAGLSASFLIVVPGSAEVERGRVRMDGGP